MKKLMPPELEKARVTAGPLASRLEYGFNGAFRMRGPLGLELFMIVSDGMGWDHVSVSVLPAHETIKQRCPRWEEMCFVKNLFWDDEEEVVQYHPRKSEYVTCHPTTLHLWRPQKKELPRPLPEMVGPK